MGAIPGHDAHSVADIPRKLRHYENGACPQRRRIKDGKKSEVEKPDRQDIIAAKQKAVDEMAFCA
jgi:hypothetical protein